MAVDKSSKRASLNSTTDWIHAGDWGIGGVERSTVDGLVASSCDESGPIEFTMSSFAFAKTTLEKVSQS